MTVDDVRALGPLHHSVVVVGDGGVLVGAVDALVARLPPGTAVRDIVVRATGTIRPEVRVDDALEQLRDDGLDYTFVTTARGALVGLFTRDAHV